MNVVTDKIYRLALRFVEIFTFLLLCLLFLGSFLLTCYTNDMNTQEVLTKWDNPLLSILGMGLLLAVFAGAAVFVCRRPKRRKKILLCLTFAWIFMLGCILILFGKSVPSADAMSVYAAAELLAAGDTSVIHPTDSYFSYYPQQVGLMAFLEVLFRIWNLTGLSLPAYHFIKGIYVLLLCAAVWFQYKSVHQLWESDRADCLYLLLAGINLPMIMYSSFLYGEIPSFAAFSAGLYFLLKFLQDALHRTSNCMSDSGSERCSSVCEQASSDSGRCSSVCEQTSSNSGRPSSGRQLLSAGILSLLFLTLSVMLRKNTLILIIAVLLVVGLEWLKHRRHVLLLFALSCAVCTLNILPATEKIYELRADNALGTGVTAMSYFAMGMQESSRANGWYNGFNFNTYQESGMNAELANKVSRLAIQERLDYFAENPGYALSFYAEKHLSQWADGTYASRQATIANFGGRHALLQSLYEGELGKFYIAYCNQYQNILYLGALIFCLSSCFSGIRRKTVLGASAADALSVQQNSTAEKAALSAQPATTTTTKKETLLTGLPIYIGLIGVIGGFLFHIIWEANSRYIFVYGLLLIPYAARGLDMLTLAAYYLCKLRKTSAS